MAYCVIIDRLPPKKADSIKIIRTVSGMEPLEAGILFNCLHGNLPCPLVAGITQEKASLLVEALAMAGGKAHVVENPISIAMILSPAANLVFEWRGPGPFKSLSPR